jgi:hypothetical protein
MRNLAPSILERKALSGGLAGDRKGNPSSAVASEIRRKAADAGHLSWIRKLAEGFISVTDRKFSSFIRAEAWNLK